MALEDSFADLDNARSEGQRLSGELNELQSRPFTLPDPNALRRSIVQSRYKDTGQADLIAQHIDDKNVQKAIEREDKMEKGGYFSDIAVNFGSMRSGTQFDALMNTSIDRDKDTTMKLLGIRKAVNAIRQESMKDDTSGFAGEIASTLGYMEKSYEAGGVGAAIGGIAGGLGAPVTAGAGFMAGQMAFTAAQARGMMFADLLDQGISYENAQLVSIGAAPVYAAVEQMTSLFPKGVSKPVVNILFRQATRGLRKAALRTAGVVLMRGAGETAEEGVQQGIEDTAYMVAREFQQGLAEDGSQLAEVTGKEIFKNMLDEAIASAATSFTIAGAFGAGDVISNVRQSQKFKAKEASLKIDDAQAQKLFDEAVVESKTAKDENGKPLGGDSTSDIYMSKLDAIDSERKDATAAESARVDAEAKQAKDLERSVLRDKFISEVEDPEMMDQIFFNADAEAIDQANANLSEERMGILRDKWKVSVLERTIDKVKAAYPEVVEAEMFDKYLRKQLETDEYSAAAIKEIIPSMSVADENLSPIENWHKFVQDQTLENYKKAQEQEKKDAVTQKEQNDILENASKTFASNDRKSIDKLKKAFAYEEQDYEAAREQWKQETIQNVSAKVDSDLSGLKRELNRDERVRITNQALKEQGLNQTVRSEILDKMFPKRTGSLSASDMAEQYIEKEHDDLQKVMDASKEAEAKVVEAVKEPTPVETTPVETPVEVVQNKEQVISKESEYIGTLEDKATVTPTMLKKQFDIGITKARKILKEMESKGLVVKDGSSWKVNRLAEITPEQETAQRAKIISVLEEGKEYTQTEIAKLVGGDEALTLKTLPRMSKEGELFGSDKRRNWKLASDVEKQELKADNEAKALATKAKGDAKGSTDEKQEFTGYVREGEMRTSAKRTADKQRIVSGEVVRVRDKFKEGDEWFHNVDVYKVTGKKMTLVRSEKMSMNDLSAMTVAYKTTHGTINTLKAAALPADKMPDVGRLDDRAGEVLGTERGFADERLERMMEVIADSAKLLDDQDKKPTIENLKKMALNNKKLTEALKNMDAIAEYRQRRSNPEIVQQSQKASFQPEDEQENNQRIIDATEGGDGNAMGVIDGLSNVPTEAIENDANTKDEKPASPKKPKNIKGSGVRSLDLLRAKDQKIADEVHTHILELNSIDALEGYGVGKELISAIKSARSNEAKANATLEAIQTLPSVQKKFLLGEAERTAKSGLNRFQQPSMSNNQSVSEKTVHSYVEDIASKTGGIYTRDRTSSNVLGTVKIHNLVVRVIYGKTSKVASGELVQDVTNKSSYTMYFDPDNGQITTIDHEFGHITRDILRSTEKEAIRAVTGFDLNSKDETVSRAADEAFARKMETAEGRREIADGLKKLSPSKQGAFIRAINKIVRFMNAVFGTNLKRFGSAREFDRLAEGLTDFSILGQGRSSIDPESQDAREMPAWHGTPHLFQPEGKFKHGRFRLDKVNTGQGIQRYGFGIYFADNEELGNEYYETFSRRDAEAKASLYKLDIPDAVIPQLLAWDKPLSKQTQFKDAVLGVIPDGATVSVNREGADNLAFDIKELLIKAFDGETKSVGSDLYGMIARMIAQRDNLTLQDGKTEAAKLLSSIGIVGNSHGKAAKSRTGAKYVIWDQNTLDKIVILERNGEALDQISSEQDARQMNTEQDAEEFQSILDEVEGYIYEYDSKIGKNGGIEQWVKENPEKYKRAKEIKAEVLRKNGYKIGEVYHGTQKQGIEVFEPKYSNKLVFFTTDKGFAQKWGESHPTTTKYNATVYSSFLKADNIFNPETQYAEIEDFLKSLDSAKGLVEIGGHKRGNWLVYEDTAVVNELYRRGYDGILLNEVTDGPQNTIAVRPNQIKSAEPFLVDDEGRIVTLDKIGNKNTSDTRFQEKADRFSDPTKAQAFLKETYGSDVWSQWAEEGKPTTFREWSVKRANELSQDVKPNAFAQKVKKEARTEDVEDVQSEGSFSLQPTVTGFARRALSRARRATFGIIGDVDLMGVINQKARRMLSIKKAKAQGDVTNIIGAYGKLVDAPEEVRNHFNKKYTAKAKSRSGKNIDVSDLSFSQAVYAVSQARSANFGVKEVDRLSRPMADLWKRGMVYKDKRFYLNSEADKKAFIASMPAEVIKESDRLALIADKLYEDTNEVFNRLYGFNLKHRDFYAHVMREREIRIQKDTPSQHTPMMAMLYSKNAMNPSEVQRLTAAGESGMMLQDIYSSTMSSVNDAASFIGLSDYIKDMQALISDKEFQALVNHRLGNDKVVGQEWLNTMERYVDTVGGTFEKTDITTQKISKPIRGTLSNAAKAFLADPFTAMKQAASYANLGGYFGRDIWLKAQAEVLSKEEMQKYMDAGFGVIKNRRNKYVGGGLANVLDEGMQRSARAVTGNITAKDKLNATQEWMMGLSKRMDLITVRQAIKMAKIKIDQTWKGPKDEKYYAAVGQEADVAVMETQVATSDIARTLMQRDRGAMKSMLTFMRGARAVSFSAIAGSGEQYFAARQHYAQVLANDGTVEQKNIARQEIADARRNFMRQFMFHGVMQSAIVTGFGKGKWVVLGALATAMYGKDEDDEDDTMMNQLVSFGGDMAGSIAGLAPLVGDIGASFVRGFIGDQQGSYSAQKRIESSGFPAIKAVTELYGGLADYKRAIKYEKQLETGKDQNGNRINKKDAEKSLERAHVDMYSGLVEWGSTWVGGLGVPRTAAQAYRTVQKRKIDRSK